MAIKRLYWNCFRGYEITRGLCNLAARERDVKWTVPLSIAKPEMTENHLLLSSLGKLGIVFEDNVSVRFWISAQ